MYHYLNMGKRSFEDIDGQDEVKLKKLFYALRASFACKWILDKDSIPPIVFQKMLDELEIPAALRTRIYELIELKSGKNEDYMHPQEPEMNAFIREQFERSEKESANLKGRKQKSVDLDGAFLTVLNDL